MNLIRLFPCGSLAKVQFFQRDKENGGFICFFLFVQENVFVMIIMLVMIVHWTGITSQY